MAWKAWLDGHENDLLDLVELFGGDDPRVGHDAQSGYYVESALLEDTAGELRAAAAEPLLKRINGIARVLRPSFRPVRLTGRYTSPDGKHSVVIATESVEARSRMGTPTILVDGMPVPAPSPKGPRYFNLAEVNVNAADVFRVMATAERQLDWYDVYKVWEIIERAVGGSSQVVANGWMTSTDINRLTASANHPGISGDEARHARGKGKPPGSNLVMSLDEANSLIRSLVSAWIESLPDS